MQNGVSRTTHQYVSIQDNLSLSLYVNPGSVVGIVIPGPSTRFSFRTLTSNVFEESLAAAVVPGPREPTSDFAFLNPLLLEMGLSVEEEN